MAKLSKYLDAYNDVSWTASCRIFQITPGSGLSDRSMESSALSANLQGRSRVDGGQHRGRQALGDDFGDGLDAGQALPGGGTAGWSVQPGVRDGAQGRGGSCQAQGHKVHQVMNQPKNETPGDQKELSTMELANFIFSVLGKWGTRKFARAARTFW